MPQSALSSPVSGAKLAENGHLSRISRKAVGQFLCSSDLLAERVGFEPTLPFRVNTLSKRAPSATRPSLRRQVGKQLRRTNFSRRTRLHLLIDSMGDRKSTRLNSSHLVISYAVFCLKKKKTMCQF